MRNILNKSLRLAWLLAALFSLCALPALGQSPATSPPLKQGAQAEDQGKQPAATVTVDVNVVTLTATVRDKHGKLVSDLNKDDFALSEDGRPQAIHYFTRENDLALTLGLLVDTSMSQRRVLDQERAASNTFLDQMVRADKDKAFVIHFDREVELLQDLTSSHQKLETALNDLQTPQLQDASGNSPGSDPSPQGGSRGWHGGGTLLYDAVYLASDELMKKQEGRKAIIVLSDGVDRGSKESLATAIESAQRANTVVYAILFKDNEGPGQRGFGRPSWGGPGMGGGGMGRRSGGQRYPQEERPDGKKVLERISKETGGRLFEISKKQPIDDIYTQIEDEMRHEYSIGYTPDRASTAAEGYHKIQLTAKPKGLTVQTREGYYADK